MDVSSYFKSLWFFIAYKSTFYMVNDFYSLTGLNDRSEKNLPWYVKHETIVIRAMVVLDTMIPKHNFLSNIFSSTYNNTNINK